MEVRKRLAFVLSAASLLLVAGLVWIVAENGSDCRSTDCRECSGEALPAECGEEEACGGNVGCESTEKKEISFCVDVYAFQQIRAAENAAASEEFSVLELNHNSLNFNHTGRELKQVELTSTHPWKIESAQDWIRVHPTSGEGSARLDISIKTSSGIARSGIVRISSGNRQLRLLVNQDGSTPSLGETEDFVSFPSTGETRKMFTGSTTSWIVEGSAPWLSLSDSTVESVRGITLTAAPNLSASRRSTTLRLKAGNFTREIQIIQEGATPEAVLKTSELRFDKEAGRREIELTTNVENLLVECRSSWVFALIQDRKLIVSIPANATISERSAIIYFKTESGRELTRLSLTQEAGEPFLRVPNSITINSLGSEVEVPVDTNCRWRVEVLEDSARWLKLSLKGGNGSDTLVLSAEQHLGIELRQATIVFRYNDTDLHLRVNQSGDSPFLRLQSSSITMAFDDRGRDLELESNIAWKLEEAPDWLSVSPASGSGKATVTLTPDRNNSEEHRQGIVSFVSEDGRRRARVEVLQKTEFSVYTDVSVLTFSSEPGFGRPLRIRATSFWRIRTFPDWLYAEQIHGVPGEHVLEFYVKDRLPNNEPRTGKIFIQCDNREIAVEVRQEQVFADSKQSDDIPKFLSLEVADSEDFLYLDAAGELREIPLPDVPLNKAGFVFCLDPDWLLCDFRRERGIPVELWIQALPNLQREPRETWVLMLLEDGNLYALALKQKAQTY
ncbi:MAG: BACON domain-containing protein [Opitutales bacterium]|nr:BACON domain-containing protein [Opitutales bacterium]